MEVGLEITFDGVCKPHQCLSFDIELKPKSTWHSKIANGEFLNPWIISAPFLCYGVMYASHHISTWWIWVDYNGVPYLSFFQVVLWHCPVIWLHASLKLLYKHQTLHRSDFEFVMVRVRMLKYFLQYTTVVCTTGYN
jgi:hypothetical protein